MSKKKHSRFYTTLRRFDGVTYPLLVLVFLVTVWELAVRIGNIPSTVLPAPFAIVGLKMVNIIKK